ncbi:hypothetical protein KVR01_012561 [Diaporthe batatas]|uniref:uncharacterized protein n=1 Tax=Diaporthe batatas TaxID=748121 RepID=UPI001D05A263|nr:uncharacterized protein KVR01_012561 [Diaporthe batatas]KAG8157519.1 hypothetical protein KVR01_012561 [Diaporthe batatas]
MYVRAVLSAFAQILYIVVAVAALDPNVIFILTDDQDARLASLDYMPYVQKRLVQKGTSFNHHYSTVALCCPSRVSLWTGKAAHNHNVTDVVEPYGGYPKFIKQGLNSNWLPVWLKAAGYNNYYVGKLFNSHTIANYFLPFPAGFKGTEFLLDPYQYSYWKPGFQRNLDIPKIYDGEYSTDLVAEKTLGFLADGVKDGRPFFLTAAPIAPHVTVNVTIDVLSFSYTLSNGPPMPAERHKGLFADSKVPRTDNFNPSVSSGASWVAQLPQLNETEVERNDEYYRERLRALQAVDEMVELIFQKLEQYTITDNTYVFFSSDNGYHIGQHRLQPGKKCGYEEDINVPLIVRGPGIPEGETVDTPTSHLDLAPTFLELLGIPLRDDFDGSPIPLPVLQSSSTTAEEPREHVQVEFWGTDNPNEWNAYANDSGFNNTYKSIRVIGDGYNVYYSVWCTNEHELYDMDVDPGQLNNLLASDANSSSIINHPVADVAKRLDALLLVLKSCQGESCRRPWTTLIPDGSIATLTEALSTSHDAVFQSFPEVSFSACVGGHVVAFEGAQFENPSQRRQLPTTDGSDPDWALMT